MVVYVWEPLVGASELHFSRIMVSLFYCGTQREQRMKITALEEESVTTHSLSS